MIRSGAGAVLRALLIAGLVGGVARAETAPRAPVLVAIPARSPEAIGGTEFARRTARISGVERQRAAIDQLSRGNLPDGLRRLQPVELEHGSSKVVIWVMPDYLAVGSDEDSLRMPLTYPSAVTVARRFGCLLPTRKIVDAIYDQAAVQLTPRPLPPGPKMRSTDYYLRHQQLIEEELGTRGGGPLIAGHKKDVVLTKRLRGRRDRIAIYGWHRGAGAPIQPLSTVHGARYADYSHGARLVWATALVDGVERAVLEILADPEWAPALTYEGEIAKPGELMTWTERSDSGG